jgi:hypothetical protein
MQAAVAGGSTVFWATPLGRLAIRLQILSKTLLNQLLSFLKTRLQKKQPY